MDKTALITGGGRGIGAATAKYLAARGYGICINYYQNEQAAQTLVAQIMEQFGVPCIAIGADVSEEAQVLRLFAEMDELLGPVTHLVNNVGVLFKQMKVSEMDAERINKTLTTNVTSYFLCSREAIKRMQPGGAIVNVSSVASRTGSAGEYVDYAASKGAVDTFTRGLSLELAPQESGSIVCGRDLSIQISMRMAASPAGLIASAARSPCCAAASQKKSHRP
ncbi:3-oxoacyl-ACP reductase [Advenella kashmirensis WT001]|uniref:3-oxoacyl-ACP reductase n=1 Tax=Advenella kashmirensis (strain DSM 17095 / LMG 22695 / WT001) TaxID=1036672 RepID=I3U7E5_ADVKW|nr:3-oxoacyl-ACP reductase [Advenella kashmirensis WT001]